MTGLVINSVIKNRFLFMFLVFDVIDKVWVLWFYENMFGKFANLFTQNSNRVLV